MCVGKGHSKRKIDAALQLRDYPPCLCMCATPKEANSKLFFIFVTTTLPKKTQIVGQNKKIGVEKTRKS
jgi:hypothetical protein